MKLLRYIAVTVVSLACLVGALVSFDIISMRQIRNLPPWIQLLLFTCYTVSCIAVVYGFIAEYRRLRRGRRTVND